MRPRRVALVLLAAIAAVAASIAAAPTAIAADQLPDLAMKPLSDIRVESSNGRRLLRFTTVIVNIGSGPFEVRGSRPEGSDPLTTDMSTKQRIYSSPSGSRDVETDALMFYSGDGHNHWHVRDLETSELIRVDNGVKVGTGAKRGFCFFDNEAYDMSLPGAPGSPRYGIGGCGSTSSTALTMGLSVGWGDRYPYYMQHQYIDVTGLSPGHYRLETVADEPNWFVESDDTNNGTSFPIQLTGNSILVETKVPVSTTIQIGTRRAGDVGRLAADDDSYFQVNSASGKTSWYGRFMGVSNRLTNLRVHYSGMTSLTSSQRIRLWNFKTGKWNRIDIRSVGPAEVSLTALPGGTLADYVSGSSGNGDVRAGVLTVRSNSTRYFTSADALSIVYDLP